MYNAIAILNSEGLQVKATAKLLRGDLLDGMPHLCLQIIWASFRSSYAPYAPHLRKWPEVSDFVALSLYVARVKKPAAMQEQHAWP